MGTFWSAALASTLTPFIQPYHATDPVTHFGKAEIGLKSSRDLFFVQPASEPNRGWLTSNPEVEKYDRQGTESRFLCGATRPGIPANEVLSWPKTT